MAAVGEQLGAAQLMRGQQDKALATYERVYTHAPDLHPLVRAIIEDDMARAWQDLGDLDPAAEFSERAATTFHDAHAGKDEFVSLERLTLTYMKMLRFDDALQTITRGIDPGHHYGTPDDVAT
jgi:tetratricopeptide (TPR) repeat protein